MWQFFYPLLLHFHLIVSEIMKKVNAENGKQFQEKSKPVLAKLCYLWRIEAINIIKQFIGDSNQIVLPFLQMVCCFRAESYLYPVSGFKISTWQIDHNNLWKEQTYLIINTLKPWMQSEHNSGGKARSPGVAKLFASTVGEIRGNLALDGWGVQVDW